MPKIWDVKDKETGKILQMQAIDAKEAVDNDPKRYSVKGYSKAAEEPGSDEEPTRAAPVQRIPRGMTAKQRAAASDLSATSGEPDKPVNEEAQERRIAEAEGENPAAVETSGPRTRKPRSKSAAKKK